MEDAYRLINADIEPAPPVGLVPAITQGSTFWRLPVEIWEDILLKEIHYGFLPRRDATLFEDIDVFGHPCKIYHYLVTIRTRLRLVCRLWSDILLNPRLEVVFVHQPRSGNQLPTPIRPAYRAEVIFAWAAYCRQWPCSSAENGVCSATKFRSRHTHRNHDEAIMINLGVLRLTNPVRERSQLLRMNLNLDALLTRFLTFRSAYEPDWASRLSHLHLDDIMDDGSVHTIELPQVVYLNLHMMLWDRQKDPIFPLDIHAPRVLTIYIQGNVHKRYCDALDGLIFRARRTLVNILLEYAEGPFFAWEKLDQFPRLKTLGLNTSRLFQPPPATFSAHPFPASSSLSFVMLSLDQHTRHPLFQACDDFGKSYVDMFSRPGKWLSKCIVPYEWKEIELLWANSNYTRGEFDWVEDVGRTPCCWVCLERLDKRGIRVEDRNGISLREGDGVAFASLMGTYEHRVS